MITRNLTLALLALALAGCTTFIASKHASQWTIELASSAALPSGACRIYDDANRLMLEGTFASGQMDGTWTHWGSQGGRYAEWSYRRGVRSGPVLMWFTPFTHPAARGILKLEGAFIDGHYEGTVTRYYPSQALQSVRVYERGLLKSSRYWSPGGTEQPAAAAKKEAAAELKVELNYLATLEDMVAQSLALAQRRVKN
jgi:hypothetical protein